LSRFSAAAFSLDFRGVSREGQEMEALSALSVVLFHFSILVPPGALQKALA
jgi:hypothetical protein